jgi:heme/copper-type cytochrome/quinol oxidase subunit 2
MWVSVAINSFFCNKRCVSSVFFELISSVGRYEVSNLAESEILIFLIMLIILVVKIVAIIFLLMYCWKFHKRLLKPRFFVAVSLAPLTDVSWWHNSFCKAILLCLVPLNNLWVSKIRAARVPL